MTGSKLYLVAVLGLLTAFTSQLLADIPPTPEQKKKIAETPRMMPKGQVTPLAERPFARTVGGAKAKVVIPKAVFDELVAVVNAKPAGGAVPATRKGLGIPPIALVFAGLALSGAFLYLLAKAPKYRTVAAGTAVILAAASVFIWSQQAQANLGPPRPRPEEGQIVIEVPTEGSEVVVYIPEPAASAPASEVKSK